jgi:hypothetical protein
LQSEIGVLRTRITQASDLLKSISEQPIDIPEREARGFSWWWYLLAPLFVILAFVAGFAFKHYRIRRRYSGFRL